MKAGVSILISDKTDFKMKAIKRAKDTYRLKRRGWEKIFHANGQDMKAGVAILTSDKIDFKTKSVKKDKEGLFNR